MLQPSLEDEQSQSSETESVSSPKRVEEIVFEPLPSNVALNDDRNTSGISIHTTAIELKPLSPQFQNRVGVAPSLSEGKKYHVFFSYEITDREWVEQITKKLESPDFGFKCSLHERDFHGGKRIIENITEHIRLSEKTVLVLSPDFLQSHWCMFEIEMGMILSMEESQLLVVPVMVKQCPVPDSIKTLTYINATPGNDWWQRFIGAIVSKDDLLTNYTGTRDVTVRPRYGNMEKLTEIVSSYKCPSGEVIRAPYVPEALLRPGIQIPPEEFDRSVDLIRSATCFCKHLYDYGPCCVPILVVLLLTGFAIMPIQASLYILRFLAGFGDCHPLFIIVPALTLPWVVFIAGYAIQRWARKRRMRKALTEANIIFLKYNIIAGFNIQMSGCVTSRTFLEFWFYNPAECKNSLARSIEGKHNGMDTQVSEVYASQLIHRHSVRYTSAYKEGQLKVKHGVRHVRNAACLCQYIEENYCEGWIPPLDVV